MREIHINRRDLRDARLVDVASAPLPDGAARLKLELFALTANNITYAAMGEGVLGYWDFFPAPEGWGKTPVWGFATVIESKAPGVEQGARYYGYYPLAETLDVTPVKAAPRGFTDGAPHRAPKAAVYNQYTNTAHDPAYDAAYEPEQTLFRPLYATGWWAADYALRDKPGAVVISSASAKTALATAHQLKALGSAERIALTSRGNMGYVADTGLYDRVLNYDDAASLRTDGATAFVDFLGRAELTATVHQALGASLARSIVIGATDWADKPGGVAPPAQRMPRPKPEFFFVPSYAAGRMQEDAALGAAMLKDMLAFYPASRAYVTAKKAEGPDAILGAWARLAEGRVPPDEGVVAAF